MLISEVFYIVIRRWCYLIGYKCCRVSVERGRITAAVATTLRFLFLDHRAAILFTIITITIFTITIISSPSSSYSSTTSKICCNLPCQQCHCKRLCQKYRPKIVSLDWSHSLLRQTANNIVRQFTKVPILVEETQRTEIQLESKQKHLKGQLGPPVSDEKVSVWNRKLSFP